MYDQALKEDPNYAEALNNRGVARIESGHPYEAIIDYNKAIVMSPQYLDALFNIERLRHRGLVPDEGHGDGWQACGTQDPVVTRGFLNR